MGIALLLLAIFLGVGSAAGYVTGNLWGALAVDALVLIGMYKMVMHDLKINPNGSPRVNAPKEPRWLTLILRVAMVAFVLTWAGASIVKWNDGAPQRAAEEAARVAHTKATADAVKSLEGQNFRSVEVNLDRGNTSGTMDASEVDYWVPIKKQGKEWTIGCETTSDTMRWHTRPDGVVDHQLATLVLKHRGCPPLLSPMLAEPRS